MATGVAMNEVTLDYLWTCFALFWLRSRAFFIGGSFGGTARRHTAGDSPTHPRNSLLLAAPVAAVAAVLLL